MKQIEVPIKTAGYKLNWLAFPTSILLLGALICLTSCGKSREIPEEVAPRPVKTVVMGDVGTLMVRTYPGLVIAGQHVQLAFQVNGPLIEFPVLSGQLVKEGELLARIDPRDYQNKLDADIADLNRTKRDWLRAKSLLSSGTIAQAQYDRFLADYEIAQARVATAKKALQDTYMYAPFSGLVASTFVENFQNVNAKQPILNLTDVSHVDIVVELPEQDMLLATKRERDTARGTVLKNAITFDALPNRKFTVTIKKYETQADPITQTYAITLTMPAADDLNILPGMTASLTLRDTQDSSRGKYVIPVTALATDDQGQSYVWLIDPDTMKISKKPVQAGEMTHNKVHIHGGLKTGDRIVTAGLPHLEAGMSVRILTERR